MPIRLDHRGIAEILKSDVVRAEIDRLAGEIARKVEADPSVVKHHVPVTVESYTTDRAAAAVLLKSAAGLGVEGKHGVLTRAAAESGLEVHHR